ncbi:hypothetical protein BUALT_Bualt14G0054000 [Buddleja alternifolia]|uniref:Cyclin-like domain-containing protein n=1 Tax=Buddleja alternifolia TaxID=168488 RepID=A0AAV6WS78_9LAMI|nr:hypothetical protein BUALT_Bualt14G0054000 [Buddleja alternifolia]
MNTSYSGSNKPTELSEQDSFCDDEEYLRCLLSKEQENKLYNGLEKNPYLAKARVEAVEWMTKVIRYYSFSTLTCILSLNYLDRFLYSSFDIDNDSDDQREKPWMIQLAAVGCLSLAAKVEEVHVPLLLELQVAAKESKYVFEPKTVQRMEILVLSTLEWKMNPVTPLSFLDYIAKRVGLKSRDLRTKCKYVLRYLICDCGFIMCYLPSVIATATMLYVIRSGMETCNVGIDQYEDRVLGIVGSINKDKVEDCSRLIQLHFDACKSSF